MSSSFLASITKSVYSTFRSQSRRFWAILTASVNVRLWDSRSFRTVFIHVIQGCQTVSSSLLVTESMAVTNAQRSNILSYFGIIWNWDFSECYCVCFVIECSSTYGWHFKIFIGVAVFLFFNLLDVLWSGNHPLIDGPSTRLVETRARQHGPCWQVMETGHPSTSPLTWAVNSGSGNWAL